MIHDPLDYKFSSDKIATDIFFIKLFIEHSTKRVFLNIFGYNNYISCITITYNNQDKLIKQRGNLKDTKTFWPQTDGLISNVIVI